MLLLLWRAISIVDANHRFFNLSRAGRCLSLALAWLLHRLPLRQGVEERIHDVDGLCHWLPVRVVDEYGCGLLSANADLIMRMRVQDLLSLRRLLAGVVSMSVLGGLWLGVRVRLMLDSSLIVV